MQDAVEVGYVVQRGGREDQVEGAVIVRGHVAQVSQLVSDVRMAPPRPGNLQHGRRDVDRQHLLEPVGEDRGVVTRTAAEINGPSSPFRQQALQDRTEGSAAEGSQAIVSLRERIEGLG